MIKSKKDYFYYLEADRIALSKPKGEMLSFSSRIKAYFFPDYIWMFQKTLRKLEYLKNTNKNLFDKVIYFFVLRKFYKLSYKLGFTIPVNVFGPGLSIAHYGTIIINTRTKVGANCRIHAGVNMGTEAGFADRAPAIGDNVYIGPGAKLFGPITIPDNTAIGANAVVNKSFETERTVLGGIPAKVISENIDIDDMLIRATKIIELGLNKEELAGRPAKEIKELLRKN